MVRNTGFVLALAALAITGCSKVESDWKATADENSIAAYEAHLASFPDTPHAAEARSAITELEWQAADGAGTIDALEQFIASHPDAPQVETAATRLEERRVAIRKADLENMGDKLRAFLDGDENANVIAMIGSQKFIPRAQQPQSGIIVHAGSKMMAVIGGAARVAYTAGEMNTIASVEEFLFAIGAPIEMTNGNRYVWQDGGWLSE